MIGIWKYLVETGFRFQCQVWPVVTVDTFYFFKIYFVIYFTVPVTAAPSSCQDNPLINCNNKNICSSNFKSYCSLTCGSCGEYLQLKCKSIWKSDTASDIGVSSCGKSHLTMLFGLHMLWLLRNKCLWFRSMFVRKPYIFTTHLNHPNQTKLRTITLAKCQFYTQSIYFLQQTNNKLRLMFWSVHSVGYWLTWITSCLNCMKTDT